MNLRQHKDTFYAAFARVGKAVGNPVRLELLDLLAQAPRGVEELAQLSAQSVANVSQHLQVLFAAGLVSRAKRGQFVTYSVASDEVAQLVRALQLVAHQHVADVERAARRFLDDDGDGPIDASELAARMRDGAVIVVDVRPPEEYAAGHLPGALSIPLADLERRLSSLPKRKEVVAYCRGPYCVLAVDAVRALRASGRRARRLEDGVREWVARGLPVSREECP
jgi:rhodanese-related sulfurtransferase